MREIFFGPQETSLHGVINHSEKVGAPAALLLHPHPQFGGNMNNNVMLGVDKELFEAGFTTLRFNFRGAGRSRGLFTGGVGEKDDVRRAVDLLATDSAVGGLALVGYSFGAAMGLPVAAEDPRIAALVGIAPPTVMADFSFLAECEKPVLIIVGSADDFADNKVLKTCLAKPRHKFELLPGADHFFIGQELRVGRIVADFLQNLVHDKTL